MSKTAPLVATRKRGQKATRTTFICLPPEERAQIERLASVEQRSISSTLRLLVLKGLAAHDAGQPLST